MPPLHQDDAALWAQVTKSLTPLKGESDRLHFGPLLDEKPAIKTARIERSHQNLSGGNLKGGQGDGLPSRITAQGTLNTRKGVTAKIEGPQQDSFSRREMRQINKGHQAIEARLDLHGLRQAGAHIALRGFIVDARARGFRHILVITGKGRSNGSDEMMFGEQEPGVLRRVVPLWLQEPDLRELVAGFSDAPRRHGGEGALYVRLRRQK